MRYRFVMLLIVSALSAEYSASQVTVAWDSLSPKTRLSFLVGSYSTETVMPPRRPGSKTATGNGTSVITWGLDSAFLMIDDEGVNTLFGKYKGHGMLGFDVPGSQYVLSMFNNSGDHPTYQGTFVADTLVLTTKVAMSGRSFDQKILWYRDGKTVKLKVMNDAGKGFVEVLEETYTPTGTNSK